MTNDRELMVRCLELAARLLQNTQSSDPAQVIAIARQLYATLPPGADASKTRQNMARAVGKIPLQARVTAGS